MYKLDELDKKILKLLQENGRYTHVEIARQLNIGHTRVRDHVIRMEEAGIITGYRPILNPKLLGYDIQAVIQIQRDTNGQIEAILPDLENIPNVVSLVHPLGNIDGLITVWAKNIDELAQIIDRINEIPDIVRTETLVILNEKSFLPPFT